MVRLPTYTLLRCVLILSEKFPFWVFQANSVMLECRPRPGYEVLSSRSAGGWGISQVTTPL